MSDRHVAIYVAANVQQAYLLRNLLEEAGIACFVSNDTLNAVHFAAGDWMVRAPGGSGFEPTAPRIVVHEDHAEQARQILMEAEATLDSGETAPELSRLEAESGEEPRWPVCPHCTRPRLATCPICQTSGTDFAEAFLPESDGAIEGEPHMVLCPTCDEAFVPRHPARCEWCGHRFRDGYDGPEKNRLVTMPQAIVEWNSRVLVVLIGMAALCAAIVGWFYYLLRS